MARHHPVLEVLVAAGEVEAQGPGVGARTGADPVGAPPARRRPPRVTTTERAAARRGATRAPQRRVVPHAGAPADHRDVLQLGALAHVELDHRRCLHGAPGSRRER